MARELTGGPVATAVQYQKHMTHHLLPDFDRSALAPLSHAFLVRDPERVLTSYAKVRDEPTLEDLGLPQQAELFERYGGPVIDAVDVLARPAVHARAPLRRPGDRLRRRDAVVAGRAA